MNVKKRLKQFSTTLTLSMIMLLHNNCGKGFQADSFGSTNNNNEDILLTENLNIGLIAHYKMDGPSLDYLGDSAGNLNDSIEILDNGTQTKKSKGAYGMEFLLDGVTGFAGSENLLEMPLQIDGFSMSLIAKNESLDTGLFHLVSFGIGEVDKAIWIGRHGKNLRAGIFGQQPIEILNFYNEESLGEYSHFILDYNGTFFKLYINGVLSGEIENTSFTYNSARLRIGKRINDEEKYWKGALTDLRIYRRSLSEKEISHLAKLDFSDRAPSSLLPIDGKFSDYGPWSGCPNVSCQETTESRVRTCTNPAPANGGKSCEGKTSETRACAIKNCPVNNPVNGGFSNWLAQGVCSKECGGGIQNYTRTCTNPAPANGGLNCIGDLTKQEACNTQACPVNNNPPPPPTQTGDIGNTDDPLLACGGLTNTSAGHGAHSNDPSKAAEHMAAMNLLLPQNASHHVMKSGNWSDPSIWMSGSVPNQGADVHIPEGICVVYDQVSNTKLHYLRVDGGIAFSKSKNTKMVVDTIIGTETSYFIMGTQKHPIKVGTTAEIIIADNGTINKTKDPEQLSRGIILHGIAHIRGMRKEAHLKIKSEPMQGDSSIETLGDNNNWRAGDEIVIMGTNTDDNQDERRTIQSVSGNILNLNKALNHNHDLPKFDKTKSPIQNVYVHVGNLTRNIVIRSENSSLATNDVLKRGHFMIMHSPSADIRYAEFKDLGRTDKRRKVNGVLNPGDQNLEGRYSLHFHKTGVEPEAKAFIAVGNSVHGSPGWGIVHHASTGAVNWNFVYNIIGAGIVSEDSNEQGEWIGNFVTSIHGNGTEFSRTESELEGDFGRSGIAFESQARHLLQKENIAANSHIGWVFNTASTRAGFLQNVPGNPMSIFPPNPKALQYNGDPFRHMGEETVNFVDFTDNMAIGVDHAMWSGHRQTVEHAGEFELHNQIKRMIVMRTRGTGLNFYMYTSLYTITESLFVDTKKAIATRNKTRRNSIVNNHFERCDEVYNHKGNHEGIIYNNSMVNVKTPFKADTLPLLNILEGNYTQIAHPSLKLDANADLEITPQDLSLNLKGTLTDSFGDYKLFGWAWHSKPGDDDIWGTSDDEYVNKGARDGLEIKLSKDCEIPPEYHPSVSRSFTDVALCPKDFFDINGTFKKSNGSWVVPVVLWIGDRMTGAPYPEIVEIKLKNFDESELEKYKLNNYPNPDPVHRRILLSH